MRIEMDASGQPARKIARRAALDLLSNVRDARDRLDDPADAAALHDFRVALRRLRSWLRAFADIFDDTLRAKDAKRLGDVARATSASRDLEVHIEWVSARRKSLRAAERPGADWLRDRLTARKTECDVALRRDVDDLLDDALRRVEKAMGKYTASVSEREPNFARVAAGLVRDHAHALHEAVERVETIGDRGRAHEARIAAKRLRYLIEPLRDGMPIVKPVIAQLTEMQDTLGALHDAQVFGGEIAAHIAESLASESSGDDHVAGLLALSRRLRRAEETAFASAKEAWFDDRAATLLSRVADVAAALDDESTRGVEIERKYLLASLPPDMPPARVETIDQGYVPGEQLIERVRRVRGADGSVAFIRTIKTGSGVERTELEEETTEPVFAALWRLTRGKRIRKRRHSVEDGGYVWEIDEFLDRDLVFAEVEMHDADETPPIPDWLAPVLIREITTDKEFSNYSMAR